METAAVKKSIPKQLLPMVEMPYQEAKSLAEKHGYIMREVNRNGHPIIIAEGLNEKRINVGTKINSTSKLFIATLYGVF